MNAHEKLYAVMEKVRHVFYNKGLGEAYDLLEIWLVDDHASVASIRGKRVEIKTFIAWILREGGISFIISHEAYHFIKSIESSQKSNLWQKSFDVVDNSNMSAWGKVFAMIAMSAVVFPVSRFISRTEELEADAFAKVITIEAGYPILDIEHLFSINEMRFSQGGDIFDKHPDYHERKRNLGLGGF